MQTKLFNSAIVFILLLFVSTNLRATSYTWKGGTSSDWATASNWNPNTGSAPGPGDNVTIAPGTYTPNLDGDRTIANFTISGSTLDLQTYTLTVTGSATCSGGNVNNGTLSVSSSSTTTFSGTQFGATLSVRSSSILLNGGIFNSAVNLFKSSSTSSTGTGGCTFNAPVLITDSGTGALTLSNNSGSPDVFNSTLKVNLKIANASVYLAHRGIGNQFNGSVTFSSTAGGHIYSNYYGTATYNDSIILDGLTSNVNFGTSTGTCVQSSGHRLLIGSGGFSSGELHLRNFTQSGTTDTLNLVPGGSSTYLNFESGCVFNSPVNAFARRVFLNGGRFLATSYFSVTGSPTSTGGSYFGAPVTIINDGVSNPTFSADTFATDAMIHGKTGVLHIVNSVFLGNTTFKNGVFLYGCDLKGNVTLDTSGASMHLGDIDYNPTTLYSGVRMTITPAYTGGLNLENFTQLGPDTLYITTQGSSRLTVDTGSIFNGPFVYRGPAIYFDGGTFNNTVDAFVSGSTSSDGKGGCIFNSTVTIKDSCTSPAYFRMAVGSPDMFNGDAFFIRKSTGSLNPVYSANSVFKGNITLDGSAAIGFGTSGNKVIFAGGANQMLNKNGSAGHFFKKIEVNKSAGTLKLNFPLTLTTDTFFLTKGVVLTDATNLLTVPDNGVMTVGSDSAYVCGPLKKVGNDVFSYALGDTALHSGAYHPLTISAASSTTDSYTAQYFTTGQTSGSSIDNTMEQLSTCEYWTLNRNTGTSNVSVTLGWNTNACNVYDPANMKVAGWNGSAWKDKGNGAYTGDINTGTVTSTSAVSTFGSFTLADNVCTTLSANTSTTDVSCHGGSNGTATAMPIRGTSPYAYSWSNGATSQTAITLTANTYSVIVTDANGCTAATSATVEEIATLTPVATAERVSSAEANDGSASVVTSGGTMPYQYLWSNSITTQTITGLAAGTYSVTITDDNGCTGIAVTSTLPRIVVSCHTDTVYAYLKKFSGSTFDSNDTVKVFVALPVGKGFHLSGLFITDSLNVVDTSYAGDTIMIYNIALRDSVKFWYGVTANCGSFHVSNLTGLHDTLTVLVNDTVVTPQIITDEYTLHSPWIKHLSTLSYVNLQTDTAPYKVKFKRYYVYVNDASGYPFTGNFFWNDTLWDANPSLQIDSVELFSTASYSLLDSSVTDTAAWIRATVSNLTDTDTIKVTEWVTVIGCSRDINHSTGYSNFYYGCNSLDTCAFTGAYPSWATTKDKVSGKYEELNEKYNYLPDTIKWQCPARDDQRIIRIINTESIADSMNVTMDRGLGINISYFIPSEVEVLNSALIPVAKRDLEITTKGSTYLPNTIASRYRFSVGGPIHKDDTLYITYPEHKWCIADVDSNFNHGVIMNNINVIDTLMHPCFPQQLGPANIYPGGRSGSQGRPMQQFSMDQFFENHTSMLDSGETAWLDITNKNLLTLNSLSAFGLNKSLMGFNQDSLKIKVKLVMKPGLFLVSDSLYLLSADSSIYPDAIIHDWNSLTDSAKGDTLVAIFSLPLNFFQSSATNSAFYKWGHLWQTSNYFDEFFNDFSVHFLIKAKCGPGYAVGGFSGVDEKFYLTYNEGCSPDCDFPLASVSDEIQITCPGCDVPGWNVSKLSIKRQSFGWADIDDDNHPDALASGIPTARATAPPANNGRAMIGDTLLIDIRANATNGKTGLTFSSIGFPFKHLWFEFPDSILPRFQFLNGIAVLNTDTIVLNQAMFVQIGPKTFLEMAVNSFAPGDSIHTGDILNIKMSYRIIDNMIDTTSYFNVEDVNGRLYMSGVDRNSTGGNIADPSGSNIDSLPPLTRKTYAYWCTAGIGRFTGIGSVFEHYARTNRIAINGVANDCYRGLYYYSVSTVGEKRNVTNPHDPYSGKELTGTKLGFKAFPFEVRDFMLLDSIKIQIPPSDWIVDSVAVRISNLMGDSLGTRFISPNGNGNYKAFDYPMGSVHINSNSNEVTLYTDSFFQFLTTPTAYNPGNCSATSKSDSCYENTLDRGDETKQVFVQLIMKMQDACSAADTTNVSGYFITAFHKHIPENLSGTQSGFGGDSIVIDTIPVPSLSNPSLFIKPRPILTSQLLPDSAGISTQKFTPQLIITKTLGFCHKSFLYAISPSGHIQVDSVRIHNDASKTFIADTNGFYHLTGANASFTSVNLDVVMNFDCSANNLSYDSILFIYGCNCYDYPTNINNVCESDTAIFRLTVKPLGKDVTITSPHIARTCDTLSYTIRFEALGDGTFTHVSDTVQLDPTLTYIPGTAKVFYNTLSDTIEPDQSITNKLIWDFDRKTVFDTLGGNHMGYFDLEFKLLTGCDYSGGGIYSSAYFTSYCGKLFSDGQAGIPDSLVRQGWQIDSIKITNLTCSADSFNFDLNVTNVGGLTHYPGVIRFSLPPNYYNSNDSIVLGPGTGSAHYSIGVFRSDSFCTINNDTVKLSLVQNAIGVCRGDTCHAELLYTSTFCPFNYPGFFPTITANSSNGNCIGDSIELCATEGDYYNWSTGEHSQCIFVHTSGDYSVAVGRPIDCERSDTITVAFDPTCCGNGKYDFPREPDNTNVWNDTTYNLQYHGFYAGVTDVYYTQTWTGNKIWCAAGTQIVVHSGVVLTLDNCWLLACGNMWKGFVVEDGGKLIVHNTIIQDAEYAIEMQRNTGLLALTNVLLLDNYVGVHFPDGGGNTYGGAFVLQTVAFIGSGSMKGAYPGQPTMPGNVPMAGIVAYDVDFSSYDVYFENLNNGMMLTSCNVNAKLNSYVDIVPDPVYAPLLNTCDGCGIFADDFAWSRILTVDSSYFYGCNIGIETYTGIDSKITNCRMDSSSNNALETGILVTFNYLNSVAISDNQIKAEQYGIDLEMNDGTDSIAITSNEILIGDPSWTANPYGVAGIRISSFGIFNGNRPLSKYRVTDNQIGLRYSAGSGIELVNTHNFNVKGNTIGLTNYQMQNYGIALLASHFNEVSCNNIGEADTSFFYSATIQAAIYSSASHDINIGCNTMDYTPNGINFENAGAAQKLYGNIINNHEEGLYVTKTGAIAAQLNYNQYNLPANTWYGTSLNIRNDAFCDSCVHGLYYYNNTSPFSFTLPNSYFPPTWFFAKKLLTNFDCASNNLVIGSSGITGYCGTVIPPLIMVPDSVDDLDLKVARNLIGFRIYNSSLQWAMKSYLFDRLYRNPGLLGADVAFDSFQSSLADSPIDVLTQVDDEASQLNVIDSDDAVTLEAYKEQMRMNLDSISVYAARYASETDSAMRAAILDSIAVYQGALTDVNTLAHDMIADYHSNVVDIATNAADLNNSFGSDLATESNLQTVNDIYLGMISIGAKKPDATQAAELYDIAVQCPMAGGSAVFKARSLYKLYDRHVIFDNSDCNTETDTCRFPDPPHIYGIASGLCSEDTMHQTYSIAPSDDATGHFWYVSDTTFAKINGNNEGESVMLDIIQPFDSVTLYVVARGECGSGEPGYITLYNKPKFPDYPDDRLVVCCSDTLTFFFPDSTMFSLEATFHGVFEQGEVHNELLAPASTNPGAENINDSYYAQNHSYIYDCDNNFYMEAEVTCSTNPTFIQIVLCGNIEDDTLTLIAANACGTDTVVWIVNDSCYSGDSCASLRKAQINQALFENNNNIEVFPNPTNGLMTIKFSSMDDDNYSLEVLDVIGGILIEENGKAKQGINKRDLDISNFVKGIYFINLRTSYSSYMVRITKQ